VIPQRIPKLVARRDAAVQSIDSAGPTDNRDEAIRRRFARYASAATLRD
jgi:hypothetical protein